MLTGCPPRCAGPGCATRTLSSCPRCTSLPSRPRAARRAAPTPPTAPSQRVLSCNLTSLPSRTFTTVLFRLSVWALPWYASCYDVGPTFEPNKFGGVGNKNTICLSYQASHIDNNLDHTCEQMQQTISQNVQNNLNKLEEDCRREVNVHLCVHAQAWAWEWVWVWEWALAWVLPWLWL